MDASNTHSGNHGQAHQEYRASWDCQLATQVCAFEKAPAAPPFPSSSGEVRVLACPYQDVEQLYTLGPELGSGSSGIVRRCVERGTGKGVACKTISKAQLLYKEDLVAVRTELVAMRMVSSHPSIVSFQGAYEDSQNVHLTMDLCSGGELFDRIQQKQRYPETEAAEVCVKLASALAFCHKFGIVHRDLKPENIFLAGQHSDTDIRLGDFGQAALFAPGDKLTQVVGSPFYIAPEVLRESYGPESDVWSMGVILYILLSGVPPFWSTSRDGIFRRIEKGAYQLRYGPWAKISAEAKDLVRRLLTMDPQQRITAEEVLDHPWIVGHCARTSPVPLAVAFSPTGLQSADLLLTLSAAPIVPSNGSRTGSRPIPIQNGPQVAPHQRYSKLMPVKSMPASQSGKALEVAPSGSGSPCSVLVDERRWEEKEALFAESLGEGGPAEQHHKQCDGPAFQPRAEAQLSTPTRRTPTSGTARGKLPSLFQVVRRDSASDPHLRPQADDCTGAIHVESSQSGRMGKGHYRYSHTGSSFDALYPAAARKSGGGHRKQLSVGSLPSSTGASVGITDQSYRQSRFAALEHSDSPIKASPRIGQDVAEVQNGSKPAGTSHLSLSATCQSGASHRNQAEAAKPPVRRASLGGPPSRLAEGDTMDSSVGPRDRRGGRRTRSNVGELLACFGLGHENRIEEAAAG